MTTNNVEESYRCDIVVSSEKKKQSSPWLLLLVPFQEEEGFFFSETKSGSLNSTVSFLNVSFLRNKPCNEVSPGSCSTNNVVRTMCFFSWNTDRFFSWRKELFWAVLQKRTIVLLLLERSKGSFQKTRTTRAAVQRRAASFLSVSSEQTIWNTPSSFALKVLVSEKNSFFQETQVCFKEEPFFFNEPI